MHFASNEPGKRSASNLKYVYRLSTKAEEGKSNMRNKHLVSALCNLFSSDILWPLSGEHEAAGSHLCTIFCFNILSGNFMQRWKYGIKGNKIFNSKVGQTILMGFSVKLISWIVSTSNKHCTKRSI